VFSDGAFSDFLSVTQGVPQGSILLFSLFINDISFLFSRYHVYADDVQIYLSGREENIESVLNQINTDHTSIFDWSTRNGLCLNSQKTQAMVISRNKPLFLPPVKVCNTVIPYSTKV
jgi:Reverse transcriptase (RNA-dependent DNA polymerase)